MGDGSLMSSFSLSAMLSNNIYDTDMATRRGFTDHEHLDEVELIHMNGRVYDYNLGRFMSVDPILHAGSQGINPYSYIMNNPLSGTDPTGYAPEKETVEYDPEKHKIIVNDKGEQALDDGSGNVLVIDSTKKTNNNGSVDTVNYDSKGKIASASSTDINGQTKIATSTAIFVSKVVTSGLKKAGSRGGPGVALGVLGVLMEEGGEALGDLVEENGVSFYPTFGGAVASTPPNGGPDDEDDNDYSGELNGKRENIRNAVNASPGEQVHHLIPWKLRTHPMVKLAARSGFNINGSRNGMSLRNHSFSIRHRRYNRIMERLLNRDFASNRNMTSQQAAKRLHYYADRARGALSRSSRQLGKK
jgi:RHS repeat-associated protein